MPRPVPHDADDVRGVPEQTLEGGVDRDRDDPHRQRDRIALRTPQRSMAVPRLEQVRQQRRHRVGTAHALTEQLRHLAPRREVRARAPRHAREPTDNLDRSPRPAALLRGQCAHEPAQDLAARPIHDRVEMRSQRRGEDLSGDVRICRAPRMRQQTRVVRLRRRSPQTRSSSRRGGVWTGVGATLARDDQQKHAPPRARLLFSTKRKQSSGRVFSDLALRAASSQLRRV